MERVCCCGVALEEGGYILKCTHILCNDCLQRNWVVDRIICPTCDASPSKQCFQKLNSFEIENQFSQILIISQNQLVEMNTQGEVKSQPRQIDLSEVDGFFEQIDDNLVVISGGKKKPQNLILVDTSLKKESYNLLFGHTSHCSQTVDGIMYIISGFDYSNMRYQPLCESFNIKTKDQKQISDILQPVQLFGVCSIEKQIYVIGGFGSMSYSQKIQLYDTQCDKWLIFEHQLSNPSVCYATSTKDSIIVFHSNINYTTKLRVSDGNTVNIAAGFKGQECRMKPIITSYGVFISDDKVYKLNFTSGSWLVLQTSHQK